MASAPRTELDPARNAPKNTDGKAAGFYELIRNAIVSGSLGPGERVSEAGLAREYGASRSPIREALASLDRDGLVERHGLMVRVRERTPEEVLDIYRLRIHIEGAIAYDAAHRRQLLDLSRLEAAIDFAADVDSDDPDAMIQANRLFHSALSVAAHNETLSETQDRLSTQVAVLPSTTLGAPGRWSEAVGEHRQIMEAVRSRDADTARTVAENHMTTARDIRLRLYEADIAF